MEVLIILGMLVYFVPAIIALLRDHRSKWAIAALNVFLGWTFLGWVVAFVWSLTNPASSQLVVNTAGGTSVAEELQRLSRLREDGVLTEREFEAKKKALLR